MRGRGSIFTGAATGARRARCLGFLLLTAAAICTALLPAGASANAPILKFYAKPSTTQAGGHPNVTTFFELGTRSTAAHPPPDCECQDAKDININYPAGFIGNPRAVPRCTQLEFATQTCPVDTQVGMSNILAAILFVNIPVYNLEPHNGEAGLLGMFVPLVNTFIYVELNPRTEGDYGLTASLTGITQLFGLELSKLTLWGVPASPANDFHRLPFGVTSCYDYFNPAFEGCEEEGKYPEIEGQYVRRVPSNAPETPFLQNPTTCGITLSTSMSDLAYDEGTSSAEYPWPATTGCDQLSFNPSLFAEPTTTATETPSGLEVDLKVPQQESPTVPSPSELRANTVTLPKGVSINPNSADGKVACTDAEARIGTREEAHCPEDSKVGSVTIESAALPAPLPGYIYIGTPLPGERFRLIYTANGFNTHIKLLAVARPDPVTGQLIVSQENLPQSPFTDFRLHYFGSERGILATGAQCGTYPVKSTFTPWDSMLAEQTSAQFFNIDSGPEGAPCPGSILPFTPRFEAASVNSAAGAHTPFSLALNRADGEQTLSGLTVSTPPGLLATLKGVTYCPEAKIVQAADPGYAGLEQQAHPSCPSSSEIGTASVAAGAGTHPIYEPGKVYLAGPYKGAPLSLVVVTPAVAGPYDLGSVVVRVALRVNPGSAQITAISDPVPQIVEGVPLRLRSVRIDLDRPGFTLNPTDCEPLPVNAEPVGDQGTVARLSAHFQVSSCASLPFAPKLALKLSGPTKHDGNPALSANLSAKPGEANIASTTVTLPPTEIIDNAHIKNPCTKVQFAAGKCPANSIIGSARAETPLLDKPLEGPVYLRSAPENRSGLPDIVAVLNGQIDINLDGKIETSGGRLRTSFRTVPDAPVSNFNLSLDGGKKGLLVNNTNICKASLAALVRIDGQNGAADHQQQKLAKPCGGSKASQKHHRARLSQSWHLHRGVAAK